MADSGLRCVWLLPLSRIKITSCFHKRTRYHVHYLACFSCSYYVSKVVARRCYPQQQKDSTSSVDPFFVCRRTIPSTRHDTTRHDTTLIISSFRHDPLPTTPARRPHHAPGDPCTAFTAVFPSVTSLQRCHEPATHHRLGAMLLYSNATTLSRRAVATIQSSM